MSNLKCQISSGLRLALVVLIAAGFVLGPPRPARAQDGELRLSFSKVWGFSGGGRVQGLFNLSGRGPQDIASVRFELDGKEIATLTQPPFNLQLNTDKYPNGRHTLSATGRTSDGRTLRSNTITAEFVSAEAGWQVAQRIMIPLLAVLGLIVVLSIVGQLALGQGRRRLEPGAPRNYGLAGGAICPKCRRPFALSFFSPHLVTRRLGRCPYCGKWSLVPQASREALAAAEAAEVKASEPTVPEASPEERLRQQIEESRYQ